jgi:hypothetical protein
LKKKDQGLKSFFLLGPRSCLSSLVPRASFLDPVFRTSGLGPVV